MTAEPQLQIQSESAPNSRPATAGADMAGPGVYSRVSILLRRTHMFVALFLTPWLTMYAVSTLVFNHNAMFQKLYGGDMQSFDKERELPYTRTFEADTDSADIGEQIRKDLDIRDKLNLREEDDDSFIFMQNGNDTFTPRRITYFPSQKMLLIERQAFRIPNLLTRLHSRVGYNGRSNASAAWAVSVDLTIFASILWIFSGFWMWWELKVTRRLGFLFALLGPAVFALILWLG